MTARVYGVGEGGYVLRDDQEREVGWVRGRSIGYTDFASEQAALRAAIVAHESMTRWSARQRGLRPDLPSRTALLRVGRADAITLGGATIGHLHRPASGRSDGGYALEIQLPPNTSEGAAITAAVVVYNAIARWRADSEAAAEEQAATV